MAIPETQLETWSHQGAIQGSSTTYNSIKSVLDAGGTAYAGKSYQVFLQGSYCNDTNIYAESDVDIIIRLDNTFHSDLKLLPENQKAAWHQAYDSATYTHVEFRRDVLDVLIKNYKADVTPGDKAIMIAANGNRRKADVITALQFRRYTKFNGLTDQTYIEGICFHDSKGERIANYPKRHSANLTAKHQATNQWFKPMARILKNLRGKLVGDGLLKAGIAPSYYLEGLLYNVPSDKFGKSYGDTFVNAVNWIQKEADKDKLVCANEQYYLLRDDAKTCWTRADCDSYLNAAIELWNNW
jgi:hypothetical protein